VSEERLSELIRAVAEGRDREAFAALFRHYAPRIRSYCRRISADEATADEVAQEAMVAVWRNADRYDPAKAGASTWIYTIVRNKRIDLIRRERRPEPLPGADVPMEAEEAAEHADPAPDAAELYGMAQQGRRLHDTLRDLPEDQSRVLHMAYFEDRPHTEISAALGLPLGTVKSRIRLALARLRGAMTEPAP
jgi:RNA polymerase sigma-70 factor (ECF subfamily)